LLTALRSPTASFHARSGSSAKLYLHDMRARAHHGRRIV
jgi:hypothetical protein